MLNNPFAPVFREAFFKDVCHDAIYTPTTLNQVPERAKAFMAEVNRFLRSCGERPILYQLYRFNEHNLFEYALFLRGYMRDAQGVLAHLSDKYACDADLVRLFKASSEYVVACNHQLGDKRVYDNGVGYKLWQLDLRRGLENAAYTRAEGKACAGRHNLFVFMPFRIYDNEVHLRHWLYKNMRRTLDNKQVFGSRADVYVCFYPIQKSRSANITSVLSTLQAPCSYMEVQDMEFVRNNWSGFVAEKIEFGADGKVAAAQPYTPQKLRDNFRHITVFSYCAGTANAHRCLVALRDMAMQIYPKAAVDEAMKEVMVVSYGYLPMQAQTMYSGVHFFSNAVNDDNRREPFVNLNNHMLYEKTKCLNADMPARISVMPDGRNYVVALKLADEVSFLQDGHVEVVRDQEYGHNMINISTPNLHNKENYAYRIFTSVLEKASLGVRGQEVLRLGERETVGNRVMNFVLQGRMQRL